MDIHSILPNAMLWPIEQILKEQLEEGAGGSLLSVKSIQWIFNRAWQSRVLQFNLKDMVACNVTAWDWIYITFTMWSWSYKYMIGSKEQPIYPWLKACSNFHLHFEWLHVSFKVFTQWLLWVQLFVTMVVGLYRRNIFLIYFQSH